MRKITRNAAAALREGRTFKEKNTEVFKERDGTFALSLHGNIVAAVKHDTRALALSLCGWNTPTTRERLNGVLSTFGVRGAGFFQRDHAAWYRDEEGREHEIDPRDVLRVEY